MLLVSEVLNLGTKRNALTERNETNWVSAEEKGTRKGKAYERQRSKRSNGTRWVEEKRPFSPAWCWKKKIDRG